MWTPRLIPALLVRGRSLVKTTGFESPRYVGDPITAVQIFNEKEVDEIIVLDIEATKRAQGPDLELVESLACECFMPLAYGGGVGSVEQMADLFAVGVEKVILNTSLSERPELLPAAAARFGSQSIVASIDARHRRFRGTTTVIRGGTKDTGQGPVAAAVAAESAGAGEIMITSVDRDGTRTGYDLELVRAVTDAVSVPVIASGGAGDLDHVRTAIVEGGATAAAVGSMVVYHGRRQAVLINFPDRADLRALTAAVEPGR